MEDTKRNYELVYHTLKESLGYKLDQSDIDNVFWTSKFYKSLEFEIEVQLNEIDLGYFGLFNYIPIELNAVEENVILTFINQLNININRGNFYLNIEDKRLCFNAFLDFYNIELTEEMVIEAVKTAVFTPILYINVIQKFVDGSDMNLDRINEILNQSLD